MPTTDAPRSTADPGVLADLLEDLKRAQGQVRALERDLANRDVDIRALEARVDHFQDQLARREEQVSVLEHRALGAEQRAEEMHGRILAIYRSTSWRLAGPMRRLVRLLRRIAGRPA